MSVRLIALTIATPNHAEVAQFWASLVGRDVVEHLDGLLLPASDSEAGLRFVHTDELPTHVPRVHLHVTSDHAASQQAVVDQALSLGASHLDVGQLPDEGHIVLADPVGRAFCVIEQGNSYLAGTGVLGEFACDGTRSIGHFWSAAFGWPLVWDQDEETAIQSPAGGTKVAWGGPPVEPHHGRDHERLELGADDMGVAVDRLLSLGAISRGTDEHGRIFQDPDGNEFRLVADPEMSASR